MTKRLARPTASLLFSVLVVSGCAHQVDRYPDTWDRLSVDNVPGRCPSLSGTYENNGVKPDGTKISLAVWLAAATGRTRQEERDNARNHFVGELFKTQAVDIKVVDDTEIAIHARGEGISIPWTISRSKGQFECKDGALVVRSSGDASGDNVAAFSSGSMKLYSGREHVMVNWNETMAGVMLFVPAVSYSDIWARFARAAK